MTNESWDALWMAACGCVIGGILGTLLYLVA